MHARAADEVGGWLGAGLLLLGRHFDDESGIGLKAV